MTISLAEILPEYTRYADIPPNYDTEKALKEFNALTPEQKAKLEASMVIVASSNEADSEFRKSSLAAAAAVQALESMFLSLKAKLGGIIEAQQFMDTFNAIQTHYRNIVKESHKLAVTISQSADNFDTLIVKFCADERLTVDQRIAKIQEYIEGANEIQGSAERMGDQFVKLKDEFSNFVGTFGTWAKSKEEADQQAIKDLYAEISALDKAISSILAIIFAPSAPFIIGAGAILAGLQLGALIGLVIEKNILLNEKLIKEGKIKDLQNEISQIKAARTQLQKDGEVALMTFTANISAIQGVWEKVVNDANIILKWLKDGAKVAEYPEYMRLALEKDVQIYRKMGAYLRDYADGVTGTIQTFKD